MFRVAHACRAWQKALFAKLKCTWDVILDVSQVCSGSTTQLAEVALYDCDGNTIPAVAGSAANPGGRQPPSEMARFALDGNVATKWLDSERDGGHQLMWQIAQPLTTIGSYSWTAANNDNGRDPKRWVLHGREHSGMGIFTVDSKYEAKSYTCGGGRPKRYNKNMFVAANFDQQCPMRKNAKSTCNGDGCDSCFEGERRGEVAGGEVPRARELGAAVLRRRGGSGMRLKFRCDVDVMCGQSRGAMSHDGHVCHLGHPPLPLP